MLAQTKYKDVEIKSERLQYKGSIDLTHIITIKRGENEISFTTYSQYLNGESPIIEKRLVQEFKGFLSDCLSFHFYCDEDENGEFHKKLSSAGEFNKCFKRYGDFCKIYPNACEKSAKETLVSLIQEMTEEGY